MPKCDHCDYCPYCRPDMQQAGRLISEFRSQLGDIISRIGVTRSAESVKAELVKLHDSYNAWVKI